MTEWPNNVPVSVSIAIMSNNSFQKQTFQIIPGLFWNAYDSDGRVHHAGPVSTSTGTPRKYHGALPSNSLPSNLDYGGLLLDWQR